MSTHDVTLDNFPNEILGIIANNLRQKDLNSLCRTSEALHIALNPLVWRNITIYTEDEWKIEDLDVGLVLRPYHYCPPQDHIQHVKNVIIAAPIHQRKRYRCLHGPDKFNRITYSPELDTPNLMNRLALSLTPFFQHLGHNQLRKFSWNLGTCLPHEVAPLFGPCGYITLKQSSIESLSLITEGLCLWIEVQETLLGLQTFKKLKHLSWKGLQARRYMKDLRGVFEGNADLLKCIELDITDWDEANDRWKHKRWHDSRWDDEVEDLSTEPTIVANFLAWKALQLQPNIHRVIFSALTELSLSNISFEGAAAELACAFNGSMLRSLRLQNCRGCPSFLHAIIDLAGVIRLKVFHLSIDDRDPEAGKLAVRTFLEAFEGLEELGLLIKPGVPTLSYWTTITHHKSTLKRLIYHERMDCGRENIFLDKHPVPERTGSIGGIPQLGFGEFLVELSLECLAVCDDLGNMKTRLKLLDSRSALKLVHVRVSGADKYYPKGEDDEGGREEDGNEDSAPSSDSVPPPRKLAVLTPLAKRQRLSLDPYRARQVRGLSDLASWAFGPNGLLNLQVLAYGDFSYQGRYIEDTFVFGRNNKFVKSPRDLPLSLQESDFGYSLLQKDERNDVLARYGDFLEACPVDSLMRLDRADMELV